MYKYTCVCVYLSHCRVHCKVHRVVKMRHTNANSLFIILGYVLFFSLFVSAFIILYCLPDANSWNRWCPGWDASFRMLWALLWQWDLRAPLGEKSTADDLLCCADDPLERCLFLSSAADKPHWHAICQYTLNRTSIEGHQQLLDYRVLFFQYSQEAEPLLFLQ